MNQSDKRESEEIVFDEHRLAQISAAADEDRRNKVGDKWIGESDARVSRIFRRKVVAEPEAGDDTQMKRQIAEVVQQTGAQAGLVFDNSAIEDLPKNHGRERVEKKVADGA